LVYFDAFAGPALHLGTDDVVLSVSKMYFAYGLGNSLFFPLLSGCEAVLHPDRPTPEVIHHLAERHSITVLFSVPTFYAHLLRAGQSQGFASLRVAVSAGEALVTNLAERARQFLGCPILDGLGSTEVGQTFVSNTVEDWRDGTVGRALPPYEIAVRDPQGRDLGPGHVGTLWVHGPTVMLEYLHKPEATAAVKVGDWLCTGDLAVLDADGFLHHRGRVDDLEMAGGISVAPREIEEVLCVHPAVSEVAVAAVRAPDGASVLKAFVVLAPAASPDAAVTLEAVEAELIVSARDRLAPYKVPRSVIFVDALPRTATGKLRRFVLRDHDATAQENRSR
jgi:fatty-acyl-CoA synthase/fatty acid CoA ligase FadD22